MLRIVYRVFDEKAFSVWNESMDNYLADSYGGQRWKSIEEFDIAFSDKKIVDRVRALLYTPDSKREKECVAVIQKAVTVDIQISPEELADIFWISDCEYQAAFFNKLSEEDTLAMQLQSVSDDATLTDGGRAVMKLIGDYAPHCIY